MSGIAVRLENISKVYKLYKAHKDRLKEAFNLSGRKYHHPFYALKNINLDIKKGEILGIIGRNGAGKSTLLRLICGIKQPSSGKVSVNGAVSALLDLSSALNPDLNGIQNIYFDGTMKGFSKEEMREKIDDIISFADIGDYIHQPLKVYSSGMRARLGFALAINMEPEILVLDEVLAVGDELFKKKCQIKMQELFESGCTVLYVTHSVDSVNEICSRAIFLEKSELLLEGPPLLVTRYYRQYISAPIEQQREIRAEIVKLNQNVERKKDFEKGIDKEELTKKNEFNKGVTESPIPIEKEISKGMRAYFIPGFIPKSTVIQKFYDVEIHEPQIQTLAGKSVNALVMDEEYIFSFKVKFNQDFALIKYGIIIQNLKGRTVSGFRILADTPASDRRVLKKDTYWVKDKFRCTLLPDTYFFSVAVTNMDGHEDEKLLLRINDLMAFKVQKEKESNYWGVVHLEQTGEIQKIEQRDQ